MDTSKILAAIDAVLAELAKGTDQVPPYQLDEGRLWVYRECEPDSGYYALMPVGYCDDMDYVDSALSKLVASGNALPGVLAAAREMVLEADATPFADQAAVALAAVRAMLAPVFAAYDLPEVRALEDA